MAEKTVDMPDTQENYPAGRHADTRTLCHSSGRYL